MFRKERGKKTLIRVSKVHILTGKNYNVTAKDSERSKIPIDYEHNQTGFHEITIRDDRGNVEKNILGHDFPSFEWSP